MFPPICFADISHSNASNVEEDLKEVLTEEEVNLLLSDKEQPIILKSKIAEIVEKTKTYFAQFLAKD
jgi:stage II sporulation protein R